ncbi:MerR family transcriptional regulator [Flavobacterium chuncheonense]|uniref:MerR family transcriptional regulator n=1 Tax=Flavobacterium chuncheonense TaxID=2026653 RepID=A0ABW5YJ52_9FLAO
MNKILTVFSVKDLENLSGIKAHTIRIWEKRYELFAPQRTDNNIRYYTTDDLKKLLNIAFLNSFGYKISKIAALSDGEIKDLVQQIHSEKTSASIAIANFKLAMFHFDSALFHKTYDDLKKTKSFEVIFEEVFMPLLDEIGLLWQTETLKPIHEHFISSLIRQKLFSAIEHLQLQQESVSNDEVFVLFLPLQEIHELGILYVHYLLLQKGKTVVYLGENVPVADLKSVTSLFDKITFVSYFTVYPTTDKVNDYLLDFHYEILQEKGNQLWILGRQSQFLNKEIEGIRSFSSIKDMLMLT